MKHHQEPAHPRGVPERDGREGRGALPLCGGDGAHSNLWGSYYDGRLYLACAKRLVALRERAEALGVTISTKTYGIRPDA